MPKNLVQVRHLTKTYELRSSGFGSNGTITAVDDVSFEIAEGEILGLVGESGSGKTTTGRILVGIEKPDSGEVIIDNKDINKLRNSELREFRSEVQLVFQDPFASLPPHLRVGSIVAEPLKIHHVTKSADESRRFVDDALAAVALVPTNEFASKRPTELSGGQRQRVAIARSLILKPKFIVADEPVSMLDVSVRVGILNLILELRNKRGVSILFITHDLSVAAYTCEKLAVMKSGKIVETGSTRDILQSPKADYTKSLLDAVPVVVRG